MCITLVITAVAATLSAHARDFVVCSQSVPDPTTKPDTKTDPKSVPVSSTVLVLDGSSLIEVTPGIGQTVRVFKRSGGGGGDSKHPTTNTNTTAAGSGGSGGALPPTAYENPLDYARALAVDRNGNCFIADRSMIWKLSPDSQYRPHHQRISG